MGEKKKRARQREGVSSGPGHEVAQEVKTCGITVRARNLEKMMSLAKKKNSCKKKALGHTRKTSNRRADRVPARG